MERGCGRGTRLSAARLLATLFVALLLALGCSKPRPFAPTDAFASRHACPESRVERIDEGENRVRVTGCGESEVYVRDCENRPSASPAGKERRAPLSENEARFSGAPSAPAETGCAWSREEERPGTNWKPDGE